MKAKPATASITKLTGVNKLTQSILALAGSASVFLLQPFFMQPLPAFAENSAMTEGVEAFKEGDFKLAESRLGCAQAAEFSNPVFHYYLANTYIKLNKKELAVQEYRIAYALAPEKEVGKFSKLALVSLGLESENKKAKVEAPKTKELPKDLALEQAKSSLQQQAENAKASTRSKGERDAMEAARNQGEILAKAQKELEDNLAKGKGNKDSLKQLQQLRQYYENQRATIERGNSRAQEIQKSADNLQTLLDEKKPIGTRKLSPVGTNLYVRNYADANDDGKANKTTMITRPLPPPSAHASGTPASPTATSATSTLPH
ncbi:hypothetical protein BH11CYA1_BH11CYA1_42380 [soil metagenome]